MAWDAPAQSGGGGSQSPWTQAINGDGYNLTNVGRARVGSEDSGNYVNIEIARDVNTVAAPLIGFVAGGVRKAVVGYDDEVQRLIMFSDITDAGISFWETGQLSFGYDKNYVTGNPVYIYTDGLHIDNQAQTPVVPVLDSYIKITTDGLVRFIPLYRDDD